MNIQKHLVPGNFATGRKGNNVTGIVLHTMVGTTKSAQAQFNNPATEVSVHYGVSLDGMVTQWVEEFNTAYQAGNYQTNLTTIGIEHEDAGDYNGLRTDALYEASSDLVADICKRYDIPCDTDHIFRHGDVIDKTAYPGGTACPDALDTNRIINMARAKLGDNMITDEDEVAELFRFGFHREPTQKEIKDNMGGAYPSVVKALRLSSAGQYANVVYNSSMSNAETVSRLNNTVDSLNRELIAGLTKQQILDYLSKNLKG